MIELIIRYAEPSAEVDRAVIPSEVVGTLVRCKDCKHYIVEGITTQYGWCHEYKHSVDEDDYCSYGDAKMKGGAE